MNWLDFGKVPIKDGRLASIYSSVCNTSLLARYLLFEWSYASAHLWWRHYVFGLSVHPCVRASVRNTSSLTWLQLNGLTDFYQTLQKCSVPSVDELIRFWQGSNQRWPSGVHLFVCLQPKLVSAISSVWVVGSSPKLHWKVTTRSRWTD